MGNNKADGIKEELEEASMKVEHCRVCPFPRSSHNLPKFQVNLFRRVFQDTLAAEMYAFLSREIELTQFIAHLFKFQAAYHRNALEALEDAIPIVESRIGTSSIPFWRSRQCRFVGLVDDAKMF